MSELRNDLPPLTQRIERLPRHRGYPVPWFVQWFEDGEPRPTGEGEPDFRVASGEKMEAAINERLCWVCGEMISQHDAPAAFVIGPMCSVNRISAEPPAHRGCAYFSVRACPFLTRPHMVRREKGINEAAEKPPGHMIERNPGVTLVWYTNSWDIVAPEGKPLFELGPPKNVTAYSQGRAATRDEVWRSIVTGLPALLQIANQQDEEEDGAIRNAAIALERQLSEAVRLLNLGSHFEEWKESDHEVAVDLYREPTAVHRRDQRQGRST